MLIQNCILKEYPRDEVNDFPEHGKPYIRRNKRISKKLWGGIIST